MKDVDTELLKLYYDLENLRNMVGEVLASSERKAKYVQKMRDVFCFEKEIHEEAVNIVRMFSHE